jgi:hypothetical protein
MRAVFWILIGALLMPSRLSAEWRVTGRIGGLMTAVATRGSFGYVAVGSRMNVYDVTDPAFPVEVGATSFFADDITDIVVDDSRAFVAAGTDGVSIIDISDPAALRVIGHWDTPGTAEGLAIDGEWIYVADGPFGLQVIDTTDPAAPRPVGSAFDTSFAFDVAILDHYAYIAAADAGLLVVDLSNRDIPRELTAMDTPGYARDLAIAGTVLYLADQWGGVRIISIAEPFSPREIAAIPLPSWAFAVSVIGSTLHVASGARGFRTFDVSDPSHPQERGSHPMTKALSWQVAAAGNRAFVGVRTGGVHLFDVAQPEPREVGRIAPLLRAGSVAIRANVAYVSTAERDIVVLDVSQPGQMRQLGAAITPGDEVGPIVTIGEAYVYVATRVLSDSRIAVYDARNPDQPVPASSLRLNFPQELVPSGSFLYVPDEFGLQVVDIVNPATPTLRGTIKLQPDSPLTTGANSVAVWGAHAFVSARTGVKVIAVGDPANMSIVGSWYGDSVSQVAYGDGYLIAATQAAGESKLGVLDVADPRQPQLVGSTALPGRSVGDVLLDGPHAYVANGAAGVVVVDIRNRNQPLVVAQIAIPGFASRLTMDRGRLFVTASEGGLFVVEQTGQQPVARGIAARHPRARPLRPAPRPVRARASGSPKSALRPYSIATSGRSVVVTSAADSGPGTLRDALANQAAGDGITFDPAVFPPASPATIQVMTPLPHIKRDGIVIDASNAGVVLDGGRLSGLFESGLEIEEPSRGNIIRGMQIVNFPSCGIFIGGAGGNIIGGDRSSGAAPTGQGNLLSHNRKAGIQIGRPYGNVIVGNLIGTDVTGRRVLGGQDIGVNLFHNTGVVGEKWEGDRIGGHEPWERNVIAGNASAEVSLHFAGNHSVIGNYIGVDVDGNPLGTAFRAIAIGASSDNLITENVVAGNHALGIIDPGSCCNAIVRNWFGVRRDGRIISGQLPGQMDNGLAINEPFNLVFENVFGGIRFNSITLIAQGGTVAETVIAGNSFLGAPPAQPSSAVAVGADSVSRTFIGGTTTRFRNSINGRGSGIVLQQGVGRTFILGNAIGSDGGTPEQVERAIEIGSSAAHSFIQSNTIANISGAGVVVSAPTNRIRQNSMYAIGESPIEWSAGAGIPAPPIISEVTLTTVTGTACAACAVEVFSDTGMQARWYEGTVVADGSGRFTFGRSTLRGTSISATATDARGSTSALSIPATSPAPPPAPTRRRAVRH